MSEPVVTAGQPAPAQPESVGFLGGFAPAPVEDVPVPAPAPVEPPKTAEPPAEPPKPEEAKQSLSEIIRAAREQRQARERAEAARAEDTKQLDELRAEVSKLKAADLEADPIGFARARGWTKETQVLVGQALLYDLVPDKAPPELRFKLLEQKQARTAAAEKAEREKAEQARMQAEQAKTIQDYATTLGRAAESFDAGTYPESEAWFADDHDTYTRSLLATADNLARAAMASGRVADLSPAAVAAVLEADIAARMGRRDQARAARQAPQAETPSGRLPQTTTTSTKGLNAGGPRAPAKTEAERIARATEVAFRTR